MTPDTDMERGFWDEAARDDLTARAEAYGGTWDTATAYEFLDAIGIFGDLPPHGYVLDLGCGPGRLTVAAAHRWPSLGFVGLDISWEMIGWADEFARGLPNVRFAVGDGRTIPDDIDHLDAAWSVLMFQHIPDGACAAYVEAVADRLKSGGRFCFQFVEGEGEDFLHHKRDAVLAQDWCHDAGLYVKGIHYGLMQEEWTWITAVKP